MTRSDPSFDPTHTLLKGLRHSGVCVLYHAPDLRIRVIENVPSAWPSAHTIAREGDSAIFDAATAELVIAAKRRALQDCEAARLEVAVVRDGQTVWFELNLEPDCDAEGGALGLFVTATDITPMKQREQVLRQLLREVSHRSRNLLAVVQGILGHTARQAGSIEAFSRDFRARIRSLARSQDLITHAEWRGASFRQLLAAQLEPYGGPGRPRIRLGGVDPVLGPNAALNIGLALHELAARSALAGALAEGKGEIAIEMVETASTLRFAWHESFAGGSRGSAAFESTILEHVVPRALHAEARLETGAGGVRYRLELPLEAVRPIAEQDAPARAAAAFATRPL